MLLPVFVAVVLGGTAFAGGRGGCVGTVLGAFTLMLIVNLLLVFNVPTFYSTVVEGCMLVAAVLAASGSRLRQVGQSFRLALLRMRSSTGPAIRRRDDGDLAPPRSDETLPAAAPKSEAGSDEALTALRKQMAEMQAQLDKLAKG